MICRNLYMNEGIIKHDVYYNFSLSDVSTYYDITFIILD